MTDDEPTTGKLLTPRQVSEHIKAATGVLITPRTISDKARRVGVSRKIGRSQLISSRDIPALLNEERTKSTGKTSRLVAQEYAEAVIAALKLAQVFGFDPEITLAEAIMSYKESGKPERYLDKINAKWGEHLIRKIRPSWVRQHAKDIYPKAANSTLNRQVITPVQAVINRAYQAEDGKQIKIEKLEIGDVRKKKPVDFDWLSSFTTHAVNPGQAALARFMYETAARISEACRVMPEDIDLPARTVKLTKTKTKPRVARVSQPMADMLADLIANAPQRHRMKKQRVNGVFGYASRHSVYNGWKTVCDRAGISYSPPHSSGRVSFATEMVVRQGVDAVTAAHLGGWASPKVMMDTYAKSEAGHDLVDSIFGKATLPTHISRRAT